jgi:hypothetical protein
MHLTTKHITKETALKFLTKEMEQTCQQQYVETLKPYFHTQ